MSDLSRRDLLKATGLALGLVAGTSGSAFAMASKERNRGTLPLKFGGYPFPRLKGLMDGSVPIRGCDVEFVPGKIGDMNTDVFSGEQVRDVTEIGLHPFMLAYANQGFRDYTLLPIFPLRTFRHKSAFIRTDRGIEKPEDLKGKRVSTAGYSSSSLTWLRGILKDEYGLEPKDMQWVIAQGDSSAQTAGKVSAQESVLPEGVPIETGPPGMDESELLAKGEVDACFHAAEPRAYIQGDPNVGRLFPDPRSVEQAWYRKTGIFPIMHTVAIRRTLLEQEPWLARAVFDAYSQAKKNDYAFMTKMGWAFSSLPWFSTELEETRRVMGENFYSYGFEANKKTLSAICRYSHDQGLASRELKSSELFAEQSLEFVES